MKKLIFKIIFVFSLLTSFLWGMFLETTFALNITHLGVWHLRNNFALLTYSFTAFFLLLLSIGILYLRFNVFNWPSIQKYLFIAGIILSLLLTIAGIEFVLYGEFNLYDVFWLTTSKQLLILVLIGCVFRIWLLERETPSDSDNAEN